MNKLRWVVPLLSASAASVVVRTADDVERRRRRMRGRMGAVVAMAHGRVKECACVVPADVLAR